jgi:hypothetical protein
MGSSPVRCTPKDIADPFPRGTAYLRHDEECHGIRYPLRGL